MNGYVSMGRCPTCGSRASVMQNPQGTLPVRYLLHKRYVIGKKLGQGGFGVTYMAWDLQENCRVAVKEYLPSEMAARKSGSSRIEAYRNPETYEKFRDRFLREAKILYKYREHPNVVSVKHLFYENNTAYYVMEFLEGEDLGAYVRRHGGRLSWQELAPMISQVVSALGAVHTDGIIHCDISPDNIFVKKNGQIKLIDFGAAKSAAGGNSTLVILKKGYAPPEQYGAHGKIGPWTDLYALAVTIYHCLTGKMPPESINRAINDSLIPPSAMGIVFPHNFSESGLLKGMSPHISTRYPDVESFWREMNRAAAREVRQHSVSAASGPALLGRAGVYENRRIEPNGMFLAGTDSRQCQILFPKGTPGVGAVHFRLWRDSGGLFLMDLASGYDTWVDYQKILPGLVYELKKGSGIRIGMNQIFEVV